MQDFSTVAKWDFKKLNFQFAIWPLFYSDDKTMDVSNSWLPPFSRGRDHFNYWLGSYDLGKDVLAGCLSGLKKSLTLAILALLFSFIPGMIIGSLFVFHSQRIKKISMMSFIILVVIAILLFYGLGLIIEWKVIPSIFIFFLISSLLLLVIGALYLRNTKPIISFDLDHISLRYIEVMKSIPVLLILLLLIQVFHHPDTLTLAGIISLIYTPTIAKYARSFTIGIAQENYITAGIAIGQTGWKLFINHVLPKLISDMLPVFAFGIANIILMESAISFLGLGLPIDEVSLGSLMHSARLNPSAWWAIIFPGLLVFWLVATFNTLGSLWNKMHLIRDLQT